MQLVILVGRNPPLAVPVNCVTLIPDSSKAALSPLVLIVQFASCIPLIPEPPMPLPLFELILIQLRESFSVVVSWTPLPPVP